MNPSFLIFGRFERHNKQHEKNKGVCYKVLTSADSYQFLFNALKKPLSLSLFIKAQAQHSYYYYYQLLLLLRSAASASVVVDDGVVVVVG